MMDRLLVATDLDRTLIPNGPAPESPGARERFGALVARPEVTLAYVTGRHLELVREAMAEHSLPRPDLVIADVGTTLYERAGDGWRRDRRWSERILGDWDGRRADDLAPLLAGLPGLRLQEPERQGEAKLSFYVDADPGESGLEAEVGRRLARAGVRATVTGSVDETRSVALLDVLPARASKLAAIEYLLDREGRARDGAVFAGDSGNDLSVLASPLRAVLVANATDEVKHEARRLSAEHGYEDALYVARGGWRGMNGNYAAGILEGIAHYEPETGDWYE
jgi:HAD superfamily hydrolase (TIGR01484 family)